LKNNSTSRAVLVAILAITPVLAQKSISSPDSDLELLQLRPNFYVIAGAGANISIQFGEDGAIVVDAGSANMSDKVIAAIKKMTSQPIRYVINTGADPDNVGGNAALAKAGQAFGTLGPSTAPVVARGEVLFRMSAPTGKVSPYPVDAWPTDTFVVKQKVMYVNDEGIQIIAMPSAHSDADSIVFFRRSDVIAAGNILDTTRFPVIDLEHGGSIQGEIDALNRLQEMAIPSTPLIYKHGGTYVVPGHGRICEQADVVEYRDMVTIIRDRVKHLIGQGMTLEQIQNASPAQGFTNRYGKDSGDWTTQQFIAAVYKSLSAKK
jgi:cyclase